MVSGRPRLAPTEATERVTVRYVASDLERLQAHADEHHKGKISAAVRVLSLKALGYQRRKAAR